MFRLEVPLLVGLVSVVSLAAPRAQSVGRLATLPNERLEALGRQGLETGDPRVAFGAWRALLLESRGADPLLARAQLGLGRSWLMLGEAEFALRYAQAVAARRPDDRAALALKVRALLRRGEFRLALDAAGRSRAVSSGGAVLGTARASALYRNRRLEEAEKVYRSILERDPSNVESLLRLGSGLLPARPAPPGLAEAVRRARGGDFEAARAELSRLAGENPDNPLALRLLGELLLERGRRRGPLSTSGIVALHFADLAAAGDIPRVFALPPSLDRSRELVLRASAMPFGRLLDALRDAGGRHDILGECERTTDAPARAWLRGKRTFDGRLWDDVRGVGGRRAATGVEALDEAASGGFQTLVHELAHQVHHHVLDSAASDRILVLYRRAREQRRLLDYYAATNAAEYFAQGVEAWYSLIKCAGQPVTHGHTRFELLRRDPALAAFIGEVCEVDPLAGPARETRLERAFEAALITGRVADAKTILGLLGRERRPALGRRLGRARARYETL